MNIKESIAKIRMNVDLLRYNSSYTSGNSAKPNTAKDLMPLRQAITDLEDIDLIKGQILFLKEGPLFSNYKDEDIFTSIDDTKIKITVDNLRIGLRFLLDYFDSLNKTTDETIQIKLPEVTTLDDLSKACSDLKKAIEMPINDSNTGGQVAILTAENGSIWLIISVTTIGAVNLIAGICWAAAVIRKKNAEAKMFEAHAKTLDLKNDALAALIEAQKSQLDNMLTSEAEAILSKHYDLKDPETLSRLKLSITTVADLIDRGAKILPNGENENLLKLFPDYSKLNLITSGIKQITEG